MQEFSSNLHKKSVLPRHRLKTGLNTPGRKSDAGLCDGTHFEPARVTGCNADFPFET